MRRILRKISSGEGDQLGDLSTLADPSIVESIVRLFFFFFPPRPFAGTLESGN